jgi:hypothetical protein
MFGGEPFLENQLAVGFTVGAMAAWPNLAKKSSFDISTARGDMQLFGFARLGARAAMAALG